MSEIDILNLVSLSPLYFIHIYISTKIYLLSITKISNRNIEHTYLHVHVEGGLAVVLLPPARAPRGSVHAARLHVPGHRDTCPAHTCRDKGTRLDSITRVPIHCPLATIHLSGHRSTCPASLSPISCKETEYLSFLNLVSVADISMALASLAVTPLTTIHTYFITHLVPVCHHMSLVTCYRGLINNICK